MYIHTHLCIYTHIGATPNPINKQLLKILILQIHIITTKSTDADTSNTSTRSSLQARPLSSLARRDLRVEGTQGVPRSGGRK